MSQKGGQWSAGLNAASTVIMVNFKALVTLGRLVLVEEVRTRVEEKVNSTKSFQSILRSGARLKSNPFRHCIQNSRHYQDAVGDKDTRDMCPDLGELNHLLGKSKTLRTAFF